MSNSISVDDFRSGLIGMLDEIFEHVHGYILDRSTSLFETLATVSAEEASRPISSQCAAIAAQVQHTRIYIEAMNELARTGEFQQVDWPASWQIGVVSDEEWQALVAGLRSSYETAKDFATNLTDWNAVMVGGAMALIAHSAYHLGEIRQALGVLRG